MRVRSYPQRATASNSRLPLQEQCKFLPNQKRKLQTELTPPKGKSLFPFPCPKDPVPDAPIDFVELWKAVSMANKSADKASNRQLSVSQGRRLAKALPLTKKFSTVLALTLYRPQR
jgi:hypothetical protein